MVRAEFCRNLWESGVCVEGVLDNLTKEPEDIPEPGVLPEDLANGCGFTLQEHHVSQRYNGSMNLVFTKSKGLE